MNVFNFLNSLNRKSYGKRLDGTEKDVGYFGVLQGIGDLKGQQVTEMSIGDPNNPNTIFRPAIVPTLNEDEPNHVLSGKFMRGVPEGERPTGIDAIIIQKSLNHAKERLSQGKDPFYSSEE